MQIWQRKITRQADGRFVFWIWIRGAKGPVNIEATERCTFPPQQKAELQAIVVNPDVPVKIVQPGPCTEFMVTVFDPADTSPVPAPTATRYSNADFTLFQTNSAEASVASIEAGQGTTYLAPQPETPSDMPGPLIREQVIIPTSLVFNHDSVVAGLDRAFSGTNYEPGEEVIIELAPGFPLTRATADADGRIAGVLTMPATTAAGTYPITATGKSSGRKGVATLTVLASQVSISQENEFEGVKSAPTGAKQAMTPQEVTAYLDNITAKPPSTKDAVFSVSKPRVDLVLDGQPVAQVISEPAAKDSATTTSTTATPDKPGLIDQARGKAQDVVEFVRRNLIPVIMALVGAIVLVLALSLMKGKKLLAGVVVK